MFRIADTPGADKRQLEGLEISVKLFRGLLARMPACAVVDADEAVDSRVDRFTRPIPIGDVMENGRLAPFEASHDPIRIAQGCDEKSHALFQSDLQPLFVLFQVLLRRLFDQQIEADRLLRHCPDVAQAVSETMLMNEGQRNRLDDADASRFGNSCHQFRIAARIHGAADHRIFNAEETGESGIGRGHVQPLSKVSNLKSKYDNTNVLNIL